jgi:Domain of unknown function (DUF5666)
MNDRMHRRQFLAAATLGSAGVVSASALGAVLPETALAEALPVDQPDPEFLEGQVTSIEGGSMMVLSGDLLLRRVLVSSGTEVWKIRDTTLDNVRAGDAVFVRGTPLKDGSFAAHNIWANIVNVHFQVAQVEPDRFHLDHGGERWIGHLHPDTVARHSLRAPTNDMSGVQAGSHVQVVGAWRPGTNEIDVSTVFA